MPSSDANEPSAFWKQIETSMKSSVPTYLKNILRLRGFDNNLSIKTLTDEDISTLETFAQTKMQKFIPPGADYKDYYHIFAENRESFEILPGHSRLLREIVKHVAAMSTTPIPSIVGSDPDSTLDFEMNGSSRKNEVDIRCTGTNEHTPFQAFIVDGSPSKFYIQMESDSKQLDDMWISMKKASEWPVLEEIVVGRMCAALYEGDYYRAKIVSLSDQGATAYYVDYGDQSVTVDLRQLPEELQKEKHLSICCRLESKSPQLIERFNKLSRDVAHEMKFIDRNCTPAIVQLVEANEATSNLSESASFHHSAPQLKTSFDSSGNQISTKISTDIRSESNALEKQFSSVHDTNKQFDEIIDTMNDAIKNIPLSKPVEALLMNAQKSDTGKMLKFTESATLNDKDIVIIRYAESPKLFSVQQTKNIAEYNVMVDKLSEYCVTAPRLVKPQIGMACAASYDSEWYRAEITGMSGNNALTRIVDYGIVLTIDINKLKNIADEFLKLPKQAISCCLLGFESLDTTNSSQDLFEFLAENKNGERRKFRVTIHGDMNGIALVNLVDTAETPVLDLSLRLLQLSLPRDVYNEYKFKNSNKVSPTSHRTNGSIACNGRELINGPTGDQRESSSITKRVPSSCAVLIKPNTEIATEDVTTNVRLSWFISPLNFYVTTVRSDADLSYTTQMKDIHHFYKNKLPISKKLQIGSYVIAKYKANNQLHRSKIIGYNDKSYQYYVRLVDVGTRTTVDPTDIYEIDKTFTKLECQAIRCSFSGVAIRSNRFDIEGKVDNLVGDRILNCKFIKKKGDTFIVDIHADGLNVRDVLVRENYLSKLAEDIEIERLVGQTVIAKIVSIKDLTSFLIIICGCESIFEASYTGANRSAMSTDKKLPTGETVPIRIDLLSLGKTFCVTPLIDSFGETPPALICTLPFFANNFQVMVMHWQSYNVAYVQSISANNFVESLLNQLFEFYENGGELQKVFTPQTVCAVKSTDSNWYRAEIISETQTGINVRYLDYGNCELIPKDLVKRLDAKFYNQAALAVKVFLPLQKVYSNRETSVDEIGKLTADVALDLKVLDFHEGKWIVDLLQNGVSITSIIKTKNCCKTLRLDEMKKLIDDVEVVQKVNRLQEQKQRANSDVKVVTPVIADTQPTKSVVPATQPSIPSANKPTTQPDTKPTGKTSTRTKAYISHIDRPDRFYLQLSSVSEALDQLQVAIQMIAPSLPELEDFSTDTLCIVRYSVDDQWYRAAIIDSDSKITSVLFIDYGNTDTITDNSMIKSVNVAFDQIPPYAIPCALPLEAKDRIEWSEESCEILKNLVDNELEFDFVCKSKSNNLVNLYQGDRDITQELIQSGFAIKLESFPICANCYISHVDSISGFNIQILTVPSESFKAWIVDGSPSKFYIQLESECSQLDHIWISMEKASEWPVLKEIVVGRMCAALYEGDYYRAKILSLSDQGATVHYVDYGNQSVTVDLRQLPEELQKEKHLSICCRLESKSGNFSSQLIERFNKLSRDVAHEMKFVCKDTTPAIVQLFENGVKFE